MKLWKRGAYGGSNKRKRFSGIGTRPVTGGYHTKRTKVKRKRG